MISVDTNLLVQAHRREAFLHAKAREVIRDLAESPVPWAVCLHSFVTTRLVNLITFCLLPAGGG
jgi:predicted nucleic acid-binding protein